MVKVNVKWNSQIFEDIDLCTSETVSVFKTQLWTLTGVPPHRQKIMFKGLLSDDSDLSKMKLKNGEKILLVGTAEGSELQKPPDQPTLFVEDLTPDEQMKIMKQRKMEVLPIGFLNLGTTCYLNSILQFLRPVVPLTNAIKTLPGDITSVDVFLKMCASFRDLYKTWQSSGTAIPPILAVHTLREAYPQFSRQNTSGDGFMQQDAEECLGCLLTTFSEKMKGKLIDELFGFEVSTTWKCIEEAEAEAEEEVKLETLRKLSCHMGVQLDPVYNIDQGIKLFLEEEMEKISSISNKKCMYRRISRLNSLPEYFIVHFVRFEWKKAHDLTRTQAGRAKICRKVEFFNTLDVFDFCSEELKEKLKFGRDVYLSRKENEYDNSTSNTRNSSSSGSNSSDNTSSNTSSNSGNNSNNNENKEELGKIEEGSSSSTSFSGGDRNMDVERKREKKEELEERETTGKRENEKDSSMEKTSATLPPQTSGMYELQSILTHQGRNAESGHYVSWVKKDEEIWWKFDDEKVSEHEWKSLDLCGGRSDYHIAILLLYKKQTIVVTEKEKEVFENKNIS